MKGAVLEPFFFFERRRCLEKKKRSNALALAKKLVLVVGLIVPRTRVLSQALAMFVYVLARVRAAPRFFYRTIHLLLG